MHVTLHEDNTVVMELIKANRIIPRLHHTDAPFCFMHNEHVLSTFDIAHCPTKIAISDFLTKPVSSQLLQRQTS